MLLFKLLAVVALVGAPALASAGVKGYSSQVREEAPPAKGYTQQVVREEAPPAKGYTQVRDEAPKTSYSPQVREELPAPAKGYSQVREEAPAAAAPAKGYSQVREEAPPAKGYTQQVVREEVQVREQAPVKGPERREDIQQEQQAPAEEPKIAEEPAKPKQVSGKTSFSKTSVVKVEQAKIEQQQQQVKIEQQQQQQLKYEPQQQLKYEPQQQQVELKQEAAEQQVQLSQEQQEQEPLYAPTKGDQISAPPGMAEPYAFNYQVEGSSRSESGDANGVIRGQYTVQGADGSSRVVDYVADHNGFRASVNTNEFGTGAQAPANVELQSSQPAAEDITLRLEGKTREDLAAPAPASVLKAPPVPPKPDNWAFKGPALSLQVPVAPPQPFFQQAPVVAVEEPAKPARRAQLESAKGERLVQRVADEQQSVSFEQQRQQVLEAPVKSSEIRAAKAASAADSRHFESATAHRVYKAPVYAAAAPAPQQAARAPVRAVAPPQAAPRAPVLAVSRAQLHRERYPPSPAQQSPRPVHPSRAFAPFYSPAPVASIADEELAAVAPAGSFDESEA